MTTFIILVTFLLTVYQGYRYVKNLMNAKGDFEDFQSHSQLQQRTPLVGRNAQAGGISQNDGYLGHHQPDTFEFDSSEVGSFPIYGDFEEYSGPTNSSF